MTTQDFPFYRADKVIGNTKGFLESQKKKMKYSYRKKGKFADKTNKIVIERRKGDVIETLHLPKPIKLWDVIKRLKTKEGEEDVKIHELSSP